MESFDPSIATLRRLNSNKIAIFFSKNTHIAKKEEIVETAGIPTTQRYDTYLGLSTLVGKSRVATFKNIKERIWKCL